jgi:hypothetical protein
MKCVSTLVTGVPSVQRHRRDTEPPPNHVLYEVPPSSWMSLYHQRSTANAGGTSSRRPHGPLFPLQRAQKAEKVRKVSELRIYVSQKATFGRCEKGLKGCKKLPTYEKYVKCVHFFTLSISSFV